MKEVMYLLVPFKEVEDIFPYARVVQGKALLQLAQIRYLKGVTGIEVIGGHEADIMIAEQEEMERNGLGDVGQNDGGGEEPAPEESEPGPEGEQSSEEAPEGGSEEESEGESDGSSGNEEEVQTNNKEDEEWVHC